jgi:hypothetical protein
VSPEFFSSLMKRASTDITHRLENVYTREKKRRSKEVKQSRLKSLQGIGVPIQGHDTATHGRPALTSSASSSGEGSGSASRYAGPSQGVSVGVIRDSRLSRQERNRSYKAIQVQASMQPPDQPQLHLVPPSLPHQRRSAPRRTPSDSVVQSHSTGGRGKRGHTTSEQGIIPVTSLSQPTTPEATYSMHASMLSRELSSQQYPSPTEIITTAPVYQASIHPSTLDRDSYRPGGASLGPGFDYTPSPTYNSGEPSLSSRSSLGDGTIATSTSSISQTAAQAPSASPFAMQKFMSENQSDIEAQLALRRRSSFDVGDFWRRTSVADAAVANFFDRVIQAKGARKDSTGSGTSPSLQRFPVSESLSFTSSSAGTAINDPSEMTEMPYTPVYSSIQQHHHHQQAIAGPSALYSADPNQFVYPQYNNRRNSEENQQVQDQYQQQQWQQEERLHSSSSSSSNLHLGQLPDFHTHRQYPQPLHTASSTGSSVGTGGLHSSAHFSDTQQYPSSAGLVNHGFSYLTPPLPIIAPPPLPTPMTELSSNMFAMGAPSQISYQNPTYPFPEDTVHHQQQYQQPQQSMSAFVSSRHGSLSSESIPEEGEEENPQ